MRGTMGLYQPGKTESSNGGLDRPPGDKGWFANGMSNIGSGFRDFGGGLSRFFSGNNDWSAPVPTIAQNPYSSGNYDEAQYQAVMRAYAAMTPEERLAAGPPPPPPEVNPYYSNVNLQRGYTNPLLGQLSEAAAGRGPSQAQNALREGTATTVATQFGAAATPSVGGAQQAALVANAQNNAAGAMQQSARQAAQLRAQEMTDARQQLGNVLNQQQGTNTQAMGLQLDREKANQNAAMGINTLNQKTGQENRGGIASLWGNISDIRAKEDMQPLAPSGFQSTIPSQSAASIYGSGGVTPAPSYMPQIESPPPTVQQAPEHEGFLSKIFSDERSKEKIRALEGALMESRRTADTIAGTGVQYPTLGLGGGSGPNAVSFGLGGQTGTTPPTARFADLATPQGSRQALGPVAPYEYRYKPEFAAATGNDTAPRAGIMAQDLERSPNPALRSAVIDTPIGKAIEPRRALSANLALSAGLDKRLRNIEGALSQPTVYPNLAR